MKISFKRVALFTLMFMLLATFAIGCQNETDDNTENNNNPTENNGNNNGNNEGNNTNDNVGNINNNVGNKTGTNIGGNYTNKDTIQGSRLEDTIANNVVNVPEVNNAVCVVTDDNECVVGVNCKGQANGTVPDDVRAKIEEAVKNANPNITQVMVTSDTDLYGKIGDVSQKVRDGNVMTDLKTDMDSIMNTIRNKMR